MKVRCLFYGLLLFALSVNAQKSIYLDAKKPIAVRVEDLIKRMTLKEKVAELNLLPYYVAQDSIIRASIRRGEVGALLKANGAALNRSLQEEAVKSSRLAIPLIFHEDVIHGYRTILPIPLAESCCWNQEMVRQGAALAAREATAAGIQLTYAPMVDISNDPRWGRIMETSGEDAFLGAALAISRVKGFQGEWLDADNTMMACVKHFAGYGDLRGGRDYQNTDFSLRDLQERYLPPFQAAVDAGVGSVMCSYTSYDGEPVTMNRFMNDTILRGQMKFTGLLMSDWTTFNHAVAEGAAADGKEAAQRGIASGLDMDMSSRQYSRHLEQLVKDKAVSVKLVDEAVRRALTVKFQMGLFDDPYRYFDVEREQKTLLSEENRNLACQLTTPTMVLLKNEQEVLPLAATQRIALVGPFVTNKSDLLGSWTMTGQAKETINVLEGMAEVLPAASLLAAGCGLDAISSAYIDSAVVVAQKSDIVVVCLGESKHIIGEGVTTAKISLPEEQISLLKAVKKTGKSVVVVLFNGRPLVLDEVLECSDAVLEAWYPGTMGGKAVALLLSGKEVPSGKLTQTFPRHSGQIPLAYNERRTFGKVYPADLPQGPLFPFGFGLSYTHYAYSDLKLNRDVLKPGESLEVSIRVKNTGKYAGREVVQLYIRDEVASIVPREKELREFASVVLNPGEEQEVKFTLPPEAFAIYNNKMKRVTEPGVFQIMVGTNSEMVQKKAVRVI